MGYEIRIARNTNWYDEDIGGGISIEEWIEYVGSQADLRLDEFAETPLPKGETLRYENEGLVVWTGYSKNQGKGNQAWLDFHEGSIVLKNPDKELVRKLYRISADLDGYVYGDDGEEYGPDGKMIPEDLSAASHDDKPWWRFW